MTLHYMARLYTSLALLAVLAGGLFQTLGALHQAWIRRAQEASEARTYLASDVCQHMAMRVRVGEFNRCAEAERALAVGPAMRAWYDVMEDWHLCGRGRCALLYLDITHHMRTLACLALLAVWVAAYAMRTWIAAGRVTHETAVYRLPTSKLKTT